MVGRSSISLPRNGSLRSENLGRNALSIIAKLCLSFFVIAVLIFTTIALTYEPQDLFNPSINTTLKSEDGVIKTRDSFVNPYQNTFPAYINIAEVDSAIGSNSVSEIRDCAIDDPVDCRDPDVFHLLMKAAMDKFKDIHFYRFGKAVRGDNDSSCHMAWRFRPKEKKSETINKDYRSFTVLRSENCTLSVFSIGDYHSGGNARKKKVNRKGKDETLPLDVGEIMDDGVLEVKTETSFSNEKYLVYHGGGDRCKSMNQYLWSFLCMLGEAEYLNRTLVLDLTICLSKMYTSSGIDEEGKDFRFYFDYERLKDTTSVYEHAQFWSDWNKWQEKNGLSLYLVEDTKITPMKLTGVKDTLIMRKFGSVEYWHGVCEGEAKSIIKRPWTKVYKSRRLLDVASAITARMNWDFDAINVDRGEKVRNKKLWPNLKKDTSVEAIMKHLETEVKDGRNLYIATNEKDVSFFDPLKEKYSTQLLERNKDLWDANSDWYFETKNLNYGHPVEFDGFMRISVDSEVFLRGKKQIETFYDLTKDCKDGINTCGFAAT